uniref:VPS9 domain-containing protein n=1 Tax=Arcella intermedia TaxID=1963864 RepID=A0A6B2LJ30_9EUKA
MGKLADLTFEHYKFLRKKEDLYHQTIDAVIKIVWLFAYDDFWNLLIKTYNTEDDVYAKKIGSLWSTLKLSSPELTVPVEFQLEGLEQPYQSAILSLQQLSNSTSIESKLKCLTQAATKIISSVDTYWAKQSAPRAITVGADEILPLMIYVVVKARVPHIFSEGIFMELFIDENQSIQQEGYVLATFQMALKEIYEMKK